MARRVVVAPNAFKGSLSAAQAAAAMAAGVTDAWPDAEVVELPLADGGVGMAELVTRALCGRMVLVTVRGPRGEPVTASYGRVGDRAYMDMAAAAGLALVPPTKRDPLRATTYGLGELMRRAMDDGCRELVVGLGDSATVDGGLGAGVALGLLAVDAQGRPVAEGGRGLAELAALDGSRLDRRLCDGTVTVTAAVDVDNPLAGPQGAAPVFGPQKGASPDTVAHLDTALAALGDLYARTFGRAVAELPGAGAAGGLGAGLAAWARAGIRSGAELVLDALRFEDRLAGVRLLLVGEGRLDAQTLRGKSPVAAARRAAACGVPVAGLAASLGPGWERLGEAGIRAVAVLVPGPLSIGEAIRQAPVLLRQATARALAWTSLGDR